MGATATSPLKRSKNREREMIPDRLRQALPFRETPEFPADVLERLASDPQLASPSGKAVIGAELGARDQIKDRDGKQPMSYRATMGSPLEFRSPPAGPA